MRLLALGALLAAFALVWPRAAGWLGDSPWRAAREISVASPEGASAELGSREDELAAALELCAAHGDFCDPEEFSAETPHVYAVVPIRMDRFEVSNQRFAAFVKATGLETLAERRGYSWDGPTRHQGLSWRRPAKDIEASQHGDWPVTHVTRAEARAFCEHAGGRLPTADEWEYQARGPERRTFPWGHAWSQERVRFSPTLALGLEPVGSHPGGTTPEGVHDLAGSVWEWTASDADAAALIKGGSWDTRNPAHFRSAAMGSLAEDETSSDLGFRCVWDR